MTKISLTAGEMQLVQNREWILAKQAIIQKVYALMGNLSAAMQAFLQQPTLVPEAVLQLPPKISKGEQYKSLPYVVLDYPRYFSRENVFAIRSFFWWGNYFSITWHLKGRFRQLYQPVIRQQVEAGLLRGFYLSFSGNEFSFNLDGRHYIYCPTAAASPSLWEPENSSFLKISFKIPLESWNQAEKVLMEGFRCFMRVAESVSCQSGAAGPSPGNPITGSDL